MQAGELHAAGTASPQPDQPAKRPTGSLCFVVTASDQLTGQMNIELWPHMTMQNELPFAVEFHLQQEPELSGERCACFAALSLRSIPWGSQIPWICQGPHADTGWVLQVL